MKKNKKEKQKQIKRKKLEEKKRQNNTIFKGITKENILKIREFSINTFSNESISREKMIEYLQNTFNIILHSSYIDKIKEMFVQNISDTWMEEKEDDIEEVETSNETIKDILTNEIEKLEDSSEESLQLKICYWSNRIAHNIENDVVGKKVKHKMNNIYIKYFLNPKSKFGLDDLLRFRENQENEEFNDWIDKILYNERENLDYSKSRNEVVDLLLGIYLRNELFTIKAQMVKELLKSTAKSEKNDVILTCVPEEQDAVSISGDKTVRLIIREKNAIAPIIMHTSEINLKENKPKEETNKSIMEFAKKGKIGIHFIMSEEELFALEYLADTKVKAQKLSEMLYKGEKDNGER